MLSHVTVTSRPIGRAPVAIRAWGFSRTAREALGGQRDSRELHSSDHDAGSGAAMALPVMEPDQRRTQTRKCPTPHARVDGTMTGVEEVQLLLGARTVTADAEVGDGRRTAGCGAMARRRSASKSNCRARCYSVAIRLRTDRRWRCARRPRRGRWLRSWPPVAHAGLTGRRARWHRSSVRQIRQDDGFPAARRPLLRACSDWLSRPTIRIHH